MKLFGAALVALTGATLCHADILYNQAFNGAGGYWATQNDTSGGNGNFATVYDNFTLAGDGNVTDLSWTGVYFNPPTPSPMAGFTIQFYSDNAGIPGASLFSTYVTGTANETDLGSFGGIETFGYSGNLGTAFGATGNTQYWISIVPDLGFPPQWGWSTGTGGDGASYQVFFGTGYVRASDEAFTLSGVATPEPVSVGLMGFGLAGIALAKFRRKRA
jgi:hypothetical protein